MNSIRWIVLGEDGRHVTLGRDTDPSAEDVENAARRLRDIKVGGWLAILKGDYYANSGDMELLMVRELSLPLEDWQSAVRKFNSIRKKFRSSKPEPN